MLYSVFNMFLTDLNNKYYTQGCLRKCIYVNLSKYFLSIWTDPLYIRTSVSKFCFITSVNLKTNVYCVCSLAPFLNPGRGLILIVNPFLYNDIH